VSWLKSLIAVLDAHPRSVAIFGAVSGWRSLNLLHSAQVAAAILAALVSLCALILTAPKAVAEVKRWFNRA
jgi:predicted nuclease with RNAse H fold